MSAGHLSREFRLAYGESPYGYLMTRRIERAMALLRRGDLFPGPFEGAPFEELLEHVRAVAGR